MLTVRLVRWQRRIHTELVKGESGGALAVIPLAVIGTGASAYVAVPSISNAQRLCYQRGESVHPKAIPVAQTARSGSKHLGFVTAGAGRKQALGVRECDPTKPTLHITRISQKNPRPWNGEEREIKKSADTALAVSLFQTVPDGEHVSSARCSARSSTRGTNVPCCMTPSSVTLVAVCP